MTFLEAAILFNAFVVVMLLGRAVRVVRLPQVPAARRSGWRSSARCWRCSARSSAPASPGSSRASIRSTGCYDSALLRHIVTGALVFGFLYTFVVALIANLRNREYRALAANLEAEARQSELSRQLAESKLKLLQLQIEPHFLFNTLGSAQQLAEKGAPEAARLISDLIRFLRAATPTLRDEATTRAAGCGDDPRVPAHHADAPGRAARVVGRHSGRRSRTRRCRPAC